MYETTKPINKDIQEVFSLLRNPGQGLISKITRIRNEKDKAKRNAIKNDLYKYEPTQITRFMSADMALRLLEIHLELKLLSIEDYITIPDSIAIKRMILHREISTLINKRMPKVSKQAASLKIN